MEHEVFVPVPAERLREALADPVRVARAVPGLQQDAGAEPVTGRLKVRVGGHTITYRGSARLSAQDDGSYAVEGDATEARGTGAVKLALTLRVGEADGGATLTFDGTASADGRVGGLPAEAVTSAVTRLLNRFAENLGKAVGEPGTAEPPASEETKETEGTEPPAADDVFVPPATEPGKPSAAEPSAGEADEPPAPGDAEPSTQGAEPPAPDTVGPPATAASLAAEATEDFEPAATGDFQAGPDADDAPVPADRPAAADAADASDALDEPTPEPVEPEAPAPHDYTPTPDLPAEAAHARRTMIGRSAEEVDHAPPRGRYAPVPAPQTIAPHPTLRWAAPAAALVLASAIVVGRMLRKRR